jgi:type II secretory pathway component PulC
LGTLLLGLTQAAAQQKPPPAPVPTAADGSMPKLRLTRRSLESLETEPKLALEVNAGVITRRTLQAELARGIGRFLRDVRTEPAFSRGRFVGWRVLELFPKRPEIKVQVLRPGDTVLRVNGHSVERPEEFKVVWDGLASASELVIEIQRDSRLSKLRYTIAD